MHILTQPEQPTLAHILFEGRAESRLRRISVSPSVFHRIQTREGEAEVHNESSEFARWILSRATLQVHDYRVTPLQRRVPAALRALRVVSVADARRRIERQPALLGPTLDALVLGVSSFFRDHVVFDQLRDWVVPELATLGRPPRVWSAACSQGYEPYSVAILLHAAGVSRFLVLGTDCRSDAIEMARRGVFPAGSMEAIHPAYAAEYFRPCGDRVLACDRLRQNCHWHVADLLIEAEPGPWDLVLCRNLAIYLKPSPAAAMWGRVNQVLRPGGYLVVGKAERPGLSELEKVGPCLYRRKTS